MNKQREALQLALETLEDLNGISTDTQSVTIWVNDEIELIEKALAELEQKPARKPLTDEEMRQCANAMDAEPLAEGWKELIKFARAIERAHGIS